MTNKKQFFVGIVLLVISLMMGLFYFEVELGLRLFVGIGIGYILSRGFLGFAGSINRAYSNGSTKLLRYMFLLFFTTSVLFAVILAAEPTYIDGLSLNPINLGLVIGAGIFGVGMALAAGCASGVLCHMTASYTKNSVALFFFSFGVFLGFSSQEKLKIVTDGPVIYFPELVDGKFMGLAFAVLVTLMLTLIVIYFAYKYEKYAKEKLGHSGIVASEKIEEKEYTIFEKIFVKQFSMPVTVLLLSMLMSSMLLIFRASWGVSTAFGFWFGKFLMLFGFSAEQLGNFTSKGAEFFEPGILENSGSVQNLGILIGSFIFIFTAQKFSNNWKMTKKEIFIYIIGGILLGVGTRFANGCNAGALYMPIAGFSLSGWVFFIFMAIGAIGGNKILKKINK